MQPSSAITDEFRAAPLRPSKAYQTIKRLEQLAAWHRLQAEFAGSVWIWEARVRTAEDLERRAADLRTRRQHLKPLQPVMPRVTTGLGAGFGETPRK
jgi:hypothetical protein